MTLPDHLPVDSELLEAVLYAKEPYLRRGVVFRPGGRAIGNVFTSWEAVVAAVGKAKAKGEGEAVTIAIDDSAAEALVPAGTYDMGGVTIEAAR